MRKEWLSVMGGLISSVGSGKNKGTIENRKVSVGSENFGYQIYIPANVKKQSSGLPVIVFLHGIGQRGSGGFVPTTGAIGAVIRQYFAQVPAIVLLPQCRAGVYWSDPVMEKMVVNSLEKTVEEFAADNARIYLTGVSMGGYGVWHFAVSQPEKFAAYVSICGGSSITNGDRYTPIAENIGKTPAWLFHGAEDRIVPVGESRQIVEAIKAKQGNVKYSEFAGVGHEVWLNVLSEKDLMPWLLAQRK
ncbi:MAG: dienelactone hydrolase family protein [Pyrinomonadaceae bacterium]